MVGEDPPQEWVMDSKDDGSGGDKRGDVKSGSDSPNSVARTSLPLNATFFKLVRAAVIRSFARVCALTGSCLGCTALLAAAESLRVTPRDANSSTVEWTEIATDPTTGTVTQRNHSYVTVGTGLNYQDDSGQWRP